MPEAEVDADAKTEAMANLVKLRDDCGHAGRTWAQYYITGQSAFGAGAAALVALWISEDKTFDLGFGVLFAVVALFATRVSNALTDIILRQHQWQGWYIDRFREIGNGDTDLRIFPDSKVHKEKDDISKRSPGAHWKNDQGSQSDTERGMGFVGNHHFRYWRCLM